jgi:hypothetical protein
MCPKFGIVATLDPWSSEIAMNNITRRLVYPSIVFALTAFASKAEPVGVFSTHEMSIHPAIGSVDPLPGLNDITQNILYSNHELVIAEVNFTQANSGHVGAGQSVDVANTDSSAIQVVSDASAAISNTIDPATMSVATDSSISVANDSSSQTAGNDSGASVGGADNLSPASATPEPSSLLLVASVLAGLGIRRRTQRK